VTVPPVADQKLALDQESFQQLLAAAYTLQENRNALQAVNSKQDSATVISEIAALRSQILAHIDEAKPDVANPRPKAAAAAAALVADCLKRLTKGDSASVCLIVDGYLRPTACSGTAVKVSGGSVASNSLVATERLRNGRAFQSANACSDIRLGPSLCVELQIGSLLAFPIERQNEIAGLIEVRWTNADAFGDGDERICQLMADLMGEVLEGERGRIKSQAIHPVQVTAPRSPISETAAPVAKSEIQDHELPSSPAVANTQVSSSDHICRVCGKPLSDDLNFCGNCGMLSSSLDDGMQGKWASMWFMQQAQKAVVTGQDPGERLWPIHGAKTQSANTPSNTVPASLNENTSDGSDNQAEIQESDETADVLADLKRSPRRVLSVLKSRFKERAIGR
jgi:hypothetical protein